MPPPRYSPFMQSPLCAASMPCASATAGGGGGRLRGRARVRPVGGQQFAAAFFLVSALPRLAQRVAARDGADGLARGGVVQERQVGLGDAAGGATAAAGSAGGGAGCVIACAASSGAGASRARAGVRRARGGRVRASAGAACAEAAGLRGGGAVQRDLDQRRLPFDPATREFHAINRQLQRREHQRVQRQRRGDARRAPAAPPRACPVAGAGVRHRPAPLSGGAASPGRYSRMSPGWHCSTSQMASSVSKRTPRTLPDLSRDVLLGDADAFGELARAHLAARQHHVEVDDDGHQTKPSLSSAMRAASTITLAIASSTTPSSSSEVVVRGEVDAELALAGAVVPGGDHRQHRADTPATQNAAASVQRAKPRRLVSARALKMRRVQVFAEQLPQPPQRGEDHGKRRDVPQHVGDARPARERRQHLGAHQAVDDAQRRSRERARCPAQLMQNSAAPAATSQRAIKSDAAEAGLGRRARRDTRAVMGLPDLVSASLEVNVKRQKLIVKR